MVSLGYGQSGLWQSRLWQSGLWQVWVVAVYPFISVISVDSSSFIPIVFSPPAHLLTVHIAVYLSTQGKENEFLEKMAKLYA